MAALLDQADGPAGPPTMVAELVSAGTALLCRCVLQQAEGRDGVEAAVAVAVDAEGRHLPGTERRFDCDTVVLGIGAVPVIELLDAAGCRVAYDSACGGTVPLLNDAGQTSVAGIFAAGDCAGIWAGKTLDPAIARDEGRRCATGLGAEPIPAAPGTDTGAYRMAWVRASVVEAEGSRTFAAARR